MFANTRLTSDQWHEYLNNQNKWHVTIIEHPAGWNPHNFEYEWYKEKNHQRRIYGTVEPIGAPNRT